jgi:SAM-dependent methyltransferase
VRDAYARHVAKDFRHHNPFFRGDATSLMTAMEENAREHPAKRLDVLNALEDADLVAVHARVQHGPDEIGYASSISSVSSVIASSNCGTSARKYRRRPSTRTECSRPTMTERVDLYSSTYRHHTHPVLDAIRKETFGEDIGQNSWITVDEVDRLVAELGPSADATLLEVASGSGGPALHLARRFGCRVTGVDSNEHGVATATQLAEAMGAGERVRFQVADANTRLPFDDASFDGLVCFDALNHLADRALVLREWRRVLRPGRRAVFTDPVVITGPITNVELAERASIGTFLFVPPARTSGSLPKRGCDSFGRRTPRRTARASRPAGAPRGRSDAKRCSSWKVKNASWACSASSRRCTP